MARAAALRAEVRKLKKQRRNGDGFNGVVRLGFDELWNADEEQRAALVRQARPDASNDGVAILSAKLPLDAWEARARASQQQLIDTLEYELTRPRNPANDNERPPTPVKWAPFTGSQMLFLASPVYEVLFHGSRGTGKSDTLLMDFYQDVGQGWGAAIKGLIVRRTYKELRDLIDKSKKLFYTIAPGAKYNASDYIWTFPDGAQLIFGYLDGPEDYLNYHGHEYSFLGADELTSWASLHQYHELKTCVRSPVPGIPLKVRATTNPSGPGHHAVKTYFIDKVLPGQVYTDPETGLQRTHIFSNVVENTLIVDTYLPTLKGIEDPNRRRAWMYGDWQVRAGGAIDDLFDRNVHILAPFKVPSNWYVDRSYDHGQSAPGAVGWWAESNGEEVTMADGTKRAFPRGTLFLISEWWIAKKNSRTEGLRLSAKEIANGITEREKHGTLAGLKVRPGPADNNIGIRGEGNTDSIADQMAKEGVRWEKSDKSKDSRMNGLTLFRQRLKASLERSSEDPGFYVFSNCPMWIGTVPDLPRDPKNPDDVDTTQADHHWDHTRYRVLAIRKQAGTARIMGMG